MVQNIQGGLQRRSIIITTTITIIMTSRRMCWRRPKRTWLFTNMGLFYHLASHDLAGFFLISIAIMLESLNGMRGVPARCHEMHL